MNSHARSCTRTAVILLAAAISGGCGSAVPSPSAGTSAAVGDFHLVVLEANATQLSLPDDLQGSWDILSKADLQRSALTFTDKDVLKYDWSNQTITLSAEASERLADLVPGSASLSLELYGRCFVVALGNHRLYGGVFLFPESAMSADYPVIYPEPNGEPGVLAIRPFTGALDYAAVPASARAVIEVKAVHDFFQQQGKLSG